MALNPMTDIRVPRIPDSTINPAKWTYERIVRSIIDFEKELDQEQEIGARLVSFTEREVIHIDDVGYWGPDIIIFYGRNADDNPVQLIQHVTQVSVLLVALPKEHDQPRRIGFQLEQKLAEEPNEDADKSSGDQ